MTDTEAQKPQAPDLDEKKSPSTGASSDQSSDEEIVGRQWQEQLMKWGVETRGIKPVPAGERKDTQFSRIFTLWFSVNFNILSFSAGVFGPIVFLLSLKSASLVIFFFNILSCIPPAYFSTWGPKSGLRQMVQARYSWGYYGVIIPVIFNLIGMMGFTILNCILGGQALSSVANGHLSSSVGIVIVAVISLVVSFCGYRVLHWYERFAWLPILIAFLVALIKGGKNLSNPVPGTGAAPAVLSFAATIAGFTITYSPLSSDFTCYMRPDAPSKRIFLWAFLGLFLPITCLQLLGAAVGACLGNVPDWADAFGANGNVGALLDAMLHPVKGFGKFLMVLIALSVMGNIAATFYSVSLNFQIILPILVKVPRYVFSIVATAIVIPLSIVGAVKFSVTLTDFLGLIGYWCSAFIAIILEEHYIFRKADWSQYDLSEWNLPGKLTTGIPAILSLGCAFALATPSMDQVWFIGPIAKKTGDIGFEMAFVVAAVVYPLLRSLEIKIRQKH